MENALCLIEKNECSLEALAFRADWRETQLTWIPLPLTPDHLQERKSKHCP